MTNNDQHQFKDRYMLRLPDGMRERIKAEADALKLSMNSLIVGVLEDRFPRAFSRQEMRKMVKAYLRTMRDYPSAPSEKDLARDEQFLVDILKYAMDEPHPHEALKEIMAEDIDISDVMMVRFVRWRRAMTDLVALAKFADGTR